MTTLVTESKEVYVNLHSAETWYSIMTVTINCDICHCVVSAIVSMDCDILLCSDRFILMCALVMSIFLYACESWTLTADTERRIQAMEMRCLRKLLGITYRDHISNEEVRNRTRQAIGPHEDLLTTVKRRKLKWYGHVTRSTRLAKTILQGTVQGGRRRGRQKKRWEDNIPEWTGMTLGAAMRKADMLEEWRELVARSYVAQVHGIG